MSYIRYTVSQAQNPEPRTPHPIPIPIPHTVHPTPYALYPKRAGSLEESFGFLPEHLHSPDLVYSADDVSIGTLSVTPFDNPTPYTLHPTPYTLHISSFTPRPSPFKLHPTAFTPNFNAPMPHVQV